MLKLVWTRVVLLAGLATLSGDHSALSRPLISAADWTGIWRGTYVCAQGVTGLFLTVKRSETGDVTAVFHFFAVRENPGVPTGDFDMTGLTGPQGNHLRLSPKAWIMQPSLYLMVGLDGDYDEASGDYAGRVHGPGCGRFVLRRDLVS
jgi:hypothetical protein